MQGNLMEYLKNWDESKNKAAVSSRSLEDKDTSEKIKKKKFEVLSKQHPLFNEHEYVFSQEVLNHLLQLLSHTYNDVVKMKYDMLWTLSSLLKNDTCHRRPILAYFERRDILEDYKCGRCNVCAPDLNFDKFTRPRLENQSLDENRRELTELLKNNTLDIHALQRLVDAYKDYRSDPYFWARGVLEGNPNNLPALYLTRAFSPPAELGANTKRLLQTVNEYSLLSQYSVVVVNSYSYPN